MKSKVQIGQRFVDNRGCSFTVIEEVEGFPKYIYKIRYDNTKSIRIVQGSNIYRGSLRDYYEKTIYGVACKGSISCKSPFEKKAFKRWYGMIERCYNPSSIGYRSYGGRGCSVSDRWLCFENFFEDVQGIPGFDMDKYLQGEIELDKDIKVKDNKVYSKDTCMFVDKKENCEVKPLAQRLVVANRGDEYYEFENISMFAKQFGLSDTSIRRALKSGQKYKDFYFRYKGEVFVRKVTDWELVADMARFTINKADLGKEPSAKFKNTILMSEHSPIRSLLFVIEMDNIPSWVSQHIARHDAFAYHTVREGALDTHFVGTQRGDRTGVPRNKLPQDAPVCHRIFLSAQDIINISALRLCRMASPETRMLWEEVKRKVAEVDEEVGKAMVARCIYRGFCPEMKPCGWCFTEAYKKQLEEYRSPSKWAEMRKERGDESE